MAHLTRCSTTPTSTSTNSESGCRSGIVQQRTRSRASTRWMSPNMLHRQVCPKCCSPRRSSASDVTATPSPNTLTWTSTQVRSPHSWGRMGQGNPRCRSRWRDCSNRWRVRSSPMTGSQANSTRCGPSTGRHVSLPRAYPTCSRTPSTNSPVRACSTRSCSAHCAREWLRSRRAHGAWTCSGDSISTNTRTSTRTRCPVARNADSPSPPHSPPHRRCCCSTNRPSDRTDVPGCRLCG